MSKKSLLRMATSICFMIIVLFFCQISVFAAVTGKSLNNPENGWQRFDDTDAKLNYSGSWKDTVISSYWNGSSKLCLKGNISTISFKFYGTKIRIIGDTSKRNAKNHIIIIDGKEYTFSEYGSSEFKVLVYERSKLDLGVHSVEIKSSSTGNLIFDAIDIDDIGYLVSDSQINNLEAISGDSTVDLKWTPAEEVTNFNIKRSTTTGGPYETIAENVVGNTYTDTGVVNGTTYYYIVTANINGRESDESNEAIATPKTDQPPTTTEAKLKVVLEVAESLRLSVNNDLDVNTEMAWSSSDQTVATVNEKGIVTAMSAGNTVITVKSVDGSYTDYINVLVVENADDYRLAIDLKVGETARLTTDDFTNTANVRWAPMDSSIANVTIKGKVTAQSKGLVLITAKDTDGNIIGQVYVRVRE